MNVNPGQDAQLRASQQRVAELEDALTEGLEGLHAEIAELTEMLTAATDTAMQRMKLIDQIRDHLEAQPPYSGSDELTDLVCDVLNMIESVEPSWGWVDPTVISDAEAPGWQPGRFTHDG